MSMFVIDAGGLVTYRVWNGDAMDEIDARALESCPNIVESLHAFAIALAPTDALLAPPLYVPTHDMHPSEDGPMCVRCGWVALCSADEGCIGDVIA